jgi:hypothetical protein
MNAPMTARRIYLAAFGLGMAWNFALALSKKLGVDLRLLDKPVHKLLAVLR